jgi:hypothetical protein
MGTNGIIRYTRLIKRREDRKVGMLNCPLWGKRFSSVAMLVALAVPRITYKTLRKVGHLGG